MSLATQKCIKLRASDNVAIVVAPKGCEATSKLEIDGTQIELMSEIPKGHKFALQDIRIGQQIVKYGSAIGIATEDIPRGGHVHRHNIRVLNENELRECNSEKSQAHKANHESKLESFMAYPRTQQRAGTRNYIAVVSTVNCSATVVKQICMRYLNHPLLAEKNIDGVVPVTHAQGCAILENDLGGRTLKRTLAGWMTHSNVVAVLGVGLGCEVTNWQTLINTIRKFDLPFDKPNKHIGIQEEGGTTAAINKGMKCVEELIAELPVFERKQVCISELSLALNCGGSDSFSGLTANPALGVASDILCAAGAGVTLAEIPECHGTEEFLLSRCERQEDREKLKSIFSWWLDYASRHDVKLDNNLAKGNIAGGLSTIIEKSLGAVTKAGSTPLTQVLDYAERITRPGASIMNTPGYDPVSVTGLVAGGSQVVAFTTGRGSVYGCSIAPTLKIATNSELAEKMSSDIDVNAGRVLRDANPEACGKEILSKIIDMAEGWKPASEVLGIGWEEFTPWPVGETL